MARPWPSVLVPSAEDWTPRGGARSAGQTFGGNEQVVMSPTARWTARLTIPCPDTPRILAARTVVALGRAASWVLGPCEVSRAPWFVDPSTGAKITYGQGARDAAIDPAWATNPDTSSRLDYQVAAPAATNATSLALQRNRGGFLAPGMMFSTGNRLHLVTALTTADPAGDDGQAAAGTIGIEFRPWLRADCPVGTPIEFGRPLATMRLATDDTGALELQLSRLGTVTLDLVEASER